MIQEAIERLVEGFDLSEIESYAVMKEIMRGDATEAQVAAYLSLLCHKGETVDEISGSVRCVRECAVPVRLKASDAIDLCGTGGDGRLSFNISTTAAFVVAGAGVKVAKHGNRAASSKCGSADVLEALGVAIDLGPENVARCVEEVGIGFIFAPLFHPAMKRVAGVRKELRIRTLFNLLGPLSNPASVKRQLIGVFDSDLMERFAQTLKRLNAECAVLVHNEDGYDEATTSCTNRILIFKDGSVSEFTIAPEDLGFTRGEKESFKGGTPKENAEITSRILGGEKSSRSDTVLFNAALALYAAGKVDNLSEGVALARESILSGSAKRVLISLLELSQSLSRGGV